MLFRSVTSGVGLDHASLCWLHDSHPEDFKKLLEWYPYAEACIWHREWYDVKPEFDDEDEEIKDAKQ